VREHRERSRALAQAARRLGADVDVTPETYEAEWKALQLRAKEQHEASIPVLRHQHERQRAAFRRIMDNRRRLEYRGGNPVHQTCIWKAVQPASFQSLPFTFNTGTAGFDPPLPVAPPPTTGKCTITLKASAVANAAPSLPFQGPVAGTEIDTFHTFETTAEVDGQLSVSAYFAPLGNIFVGMPGSCLFPGGTHVGMELFMNVRAGGIDLPVGPSRMILDQDLRASCAGESRNFLIGVSGGDAYEVSNPNLGSVQAGDTIRVKAAYAIYLAADWRGVCQATFASTTAPFFGLNVPLVLVTISS